MAETMNPIETIKEDALINAEFRKRTSSQNADVYKILSILYGLVVFISGVAFSISHAIVSGKEAEIIKYLAEIYFTYLYWVSIVWMLFCIIDIVHHRKKVETPMKNLNRLISNQLSETSDGRAVQNKRTSNVSEAYRNSSLTPYPNLPLFETCEENSLDDNDNERSEIHPNRQSIDNDDTCHPCDSRVKSNSLNNVSHRSSIIDTTRDILTRRHALDSTEKQDLRVYMFRRRNSIVEHVIGYNYDDNSTVGGLYTRVGIGIFCLGTVIHSSLSILSNLENLSCVRWAAVMDDFSRLLFSFTQFFFIFKHSNLIIRAHEGLARLAVIHIVITNLCVWFRMIVIETKSQIMEVDGHETAIIQQQYNSGSHVNNNDGNAANLLHRLLIFPSQCSDLLANGYGLPATTFIHASYMKLTPLLYSCTVEFSLMCLTLFFVIWENIGKTFSHKISDESSTKNVFMVNCHSSLKGLFGGMICFSCTILSIILYVVFRNKVGEPAHPTSTKLVDRIQNHSHSNMADQATGLDRQHSMSSIISATRITTHDPFPSMSTALKRIDYSIVILEIVNLCLLALSLFATMWSLIKIRKFSYRRTTTRFDDVLIILSLTGIYLYLIFSAFAIISNLSSSTWFAYVKVAVIILEFTEGTFHALFILMALRKRLRRTSKHHYPAREIITLLIMLDLSLWFEKTTTTTKHEANPFQLAFYHRVSWSIISAIATPLQIFFRFHASVCLSHVWANMYHLSTSEAVAARDFRPSF